MWSVADSSLVGDLAGRFVRDEPFVFCLGVAVASACHAAEKGWLAFHGGRQGGVDVLWRVS